MGIIKLVREIFLYLIVTVFVVTMCSFIFITTVYAIEAKTQKEFFVMSAGDCRIVNTKLAYDNDYRIQTYSLTKKSTGEIRFHVIAIDKNNIVKDVSNLDRDVKNDNGKTMEQFLSEEGVEKTLLYSAEYKNKKLINKKINTYSSIQSYIAAYYVPLSTFVYKD